MNNDFLKNPGERLLEILMRYLEKIPGKVLISLLLVVLLLNPFLVSGNNNGEKRSGKWKLVWEDQFDGGELDLTKWVLIQTPPSQYAKSSDWKKHMIADKAVYTVRNGNIYLKAINNPGNLKE